ncbi:hypothetical protein ACT8ZV_22325 [Nocardioides sp. MAHUQ-72]|uniref:hypothetical protein n=1 Tax=unclassified Nocardioides TaxID=2615069 RepID=UPI00361E41B8
MTTEKDCLAAAEALTRLGGIATRRELLALTTRRRLRAAVDAGDLIELGRSRLALPTADGARCAAVRLGGTVSHLSAAQHWQWKVKLPPARPTITVPRRRHGLAADDVELHWADLPAARVRDGVTCPVQTVIDCARTYDFDAALAVADSALRAGVDRGELLAAAHASPRTGRGRAIRVIEAADARAANPFESVLRAIALEVPGLTVEPQQWVGDIGRADLMDRRLGLVIEAESFEFHADSDSFGRDVRRYTGFARAGWIVVRFTWKEVMFDPDYVRAVLTDLVALGPRACLSHPAP